MLFLFYLPILPMSGQAFYRSTILVLVALIYGLLLTLMNVYWDEAPMLFVFGLRQNSVTLAMANTPQLPGVCLWLGGIWIIRGVFGLP